MESSGTWNRWQEQKKQNINDKDQTHNHQDEKKTCKGYQIVSRIYLRKEISRVNRPKTDDKFNELIDYFASMNQHEHSSNIRKEEEDIAQKTMQRKEE